MAATRPPTAPFRSPRRLVLSLSSPRGRASLTTSVVGSLPWSRPSARATPAFPSCLQRGRADPGPRFTMFTRPTRERIGPPIRVDPSGPRCLAQLPRARTTPALSSTLFSNPGHIFDLPTRAVLRSLMPKCLLCNEELPDDLDACNRCADEIPTVRVYDRKLHSCITNARLLRFNGAFLDWNVVGLVDFSRRWPEAALAVARARFPSRLLGLLLRVALGEGRRLALLCLLRLLKLLAKLTVLAISPSTARHAQEAGAEWRRHKGTNSASQSADPWPRSLGRRLRASSCSSFGHAFGFARTVYRRNR